MGSLCNKDKQVQVNEEQEAAKLSRKKQQIVKEFVQAEHRQGELIFHSQNIIDFDDKTNLQRTIQQINRKFSEVARKDFRFTLDLVTAHIRLFSQRNVGVGSFAQDSKTYPIMANKGFGLVYAKFHLEKVQPPKPKEGRQPQPNTFLILVFKVIKPEPPKTKLELSSYFQFSGIEPKEKRQEIVNAIWATYERQKPKSPEDIRQERQRQAILQQLNNI